MNRMWRKAWWRERFELARAGSSNNLQSMEGLRGFAVFLVFLVHFVSLSAPWLNETSALFPIANAVHSIGNAGVDLFFVLSGYLIYGSLIERKQVFLPYLKRRLQRIYPAFLVVLAAYLALSFLFPAESKLPEDSGEAALYVAENLLLLPGLLPIVPIITVAWSLSYEFFYYLVTPVVIGMLALRDRKVGQRIGLFAFLGVTMLLIGAVYGGHVRLTMFIAGILLFEISRHRLADLRSPWLAAAALVLGLLATLLPITGSAGQALETAILCLSFFLLGLHCFNRRSGWLVRALCWLPLRWLGNMSYSYYLIHGLTLKAGFLVFAKLVAPAAYGAWLVLELLPVMFVLTLVPAALLFLIIERPFSLVPATAKARPATAAPSVA